MTPPGDAMPTIDLGLRGPTEARWSQVHRRLGPFAWPACDRLVVVSPHPDDETLGAGGCIGVALRLGMEVVVVSVTDGEAASTDPGLARVRRDELHRAMACLDPAGSIRVHRLGLPDGAVTSSVDHATTALAAHLRPRDLVLCPLGRDGHPDHHATSQAAIAAADAAGAAVRTFPIWAWHCHDPSHTEISRGERVELPTDVLERKRRAVACFASQIGGRSPVVPAAMLTRLLRTFEVLVQP